MHALKRPKQLSREGHIKAGAIISNVIDGLTVFIRCAELDPRARMLRSKFPGVPQKILDDDQQQSGIAFHKHIIRDIEFNISSRLPLFQFGSHGSG